MTRIHWCDCAIYNEPALPAGSCDCGGLDLADDPGEHLVAPPVPWSRGAGFLIQHAQSDDVTRQQWLPPDAISANASTSGLPDAHGQVASGCHATRVNLNDPIEPVVADLKATP